MFARYLLLTWMGNACRHDLVFYALYVRGNMKFYQWLTIFIMTMCLCTQVMAQENANDANAEANQDEVSQYDGGSFTIVPPKNWLLVSGNLDPKDVAKLPENVKEHYTQRNTDVIFMDTSSPDADAKGFKDSLNIVTINEPIPLSDELVKELINVLKQQYAAMFEKFELDTIDVAELNGKQVLSVKGAYTILNYKVKMEQTLIPAKEESLVLTCTYDTEKENSGEVIESCRKAVESLVLK